MTSKRKFPRWLKQHYEQPSFIAGGGMGNVFKAYHRRRGQWEAVKVMPDVGVEPPRLGREIAASRYYGGPHVVTVYEDGHDDGYYWYAMELVSGGSLEDMLKRTSGGLELTTVLDYLTQACLGLGPAHDLRNVHRDIKPANLLLTDDGVVKVADWGVTKMARDPSGQEVVPLTEIGGTFGTVPYMSSELLRGKPCPACDVWALGITLVQLVTGVLISGKGTSLEQRILDVVEFVRGIESDGLQSTLRSRGADLQDADLLALLSECLVPACNKRIPTATHLGLRLSRLLRAKERDSFHQALAAERARAEEALREHDRVAQAIREQHATALAQLAFEAQAAVDRAVAAAHAEHAGVVHALKTVHAEALAEQAAAHAQAAIRLAARGTNPFEHTGVQEVFGRRADVDRLAQRLLATQPFVLHGAAGLGKSCLLREVVGTVLARRPDWVLVTVEIDRLWTRGARVFRAVFDGLARETGFAAPEGELTAEAFLDALSGYKEESLRTRPGHRVVLFLDPYDQLVPEAGVAGISDFPIVLSAWNRLFKEGWFLPIFCGRTAAITRAANFGAFENPFLDALLDEELGPMSRDEHHAMMRALASRQYKVRIGSAALDAIFEQTSGHPAQSRRLGTAVFNSCDGDVSLAQVAAAAARAAVR